VVEWSKSLDSVGVIGVIGGGSYGATSIILNIDNIVSFLRLPPASSTNLLLDRSKAAVRRAERLLN
jgi:hypothetical protein